MIFETLRPRAVSLGTTMKTTLSFGSNTGLVWVALCLSLNAAPITDQHLRSHALSDGSSSAVLPGGALIHVQVNHLFQTMERLEATLLPAVPVRMLPPEVQDMLRMDRPLLTVFGLQTFQEPLDPAVIRRHIGINPEASLTLTLYPGDPRRMFVLGVPMGSRQALGLTLSGLLRPQQVEEVTISGHPAVQIVPGNIPAISELYMVCSSDVVYLCGDRSLALALHSTPRGQRLDRDPFLGRVLEEEGAQGLMVLLNPAMVRPVVLQIQQFQPLMRMLLRQQRDRLMAQIPNKARQPIELQLRSELGIRDLSELAEYVEAMLMVTLEQGLEFATNELIAFEGLSFTADLDPGFPKANLRVYSSRFQPESTAAPVPLDEVRDALRWLGEGSGLISVTGHKPTRPASPVITEWTARVQTELAGRGLKSRFFEQFTDLLANERALDPIESRGTWTLTGHHPLTPPIRLEDAASLSDYFSNLRLPIHRPVRLLPGADLDLLETWLEDQTTARNMNRERGLEFARSFSNYQPWFDVVNRFKTNAKDSTASPIHRYITESAILSRGGLFGYDQHEFISRRIWSARALPGGVVFHQGRGEPVWLANLNGQEKAPLPPAIDKLLNRVPEGANYVQIHRSLQRLPAAVGWLASLEARIHADLTSYLEDCRRVWHSDDPKQQRRQRMESIPMPEAVYALSLDPETDTLYCLLPGSFPYPRARFLPILQDLLADYAASANEVGGSVCYTRVRPEVFELGLVQSTEGMARLISATGNRLFDRYVSQPAEIEALQARLSHPHDGSPELADHILVVNPRWSFIPQQSPRQKAAPTEPIPARDGNAGEHLLDLTAHYHGALTETWHKGGLANNTLANLPSGIQTFGGVEFDVRGVVQLSGRAPVQALSVRFPKAIEGIAVGKSARRIHFLHAAGWSSPIGTVIGHYVVHYADGHAQEIPIVYGEDVRDWWTQANEAGRGSAEPVWSGPNTTSPDGPEVSLYVTSWVNSRPDQTIESIDYRSAMEDAAPFLVAITLDPAGS
jgi:hypothetical protein